MNESDRDEVAYKIANWDLTLGVANRAHRDATGNIYDKFRYNNVTGYIYIGTWPDSLIINSRRHF